MRAAIKPRAWASRLADDAIAAVYCSPMRRTIETAALIAEAHKLAPVTRPGLREIDHGHWEGLTRQEVEQRFGDEYARWEEDPFTVAPAGGECGVDVMARALPVMRSHHRVAPGPERAGGVAQSDDPPGDQQPARL